MKNEEHSIPSCKISLKKKRYLGKSSTKLNRKCRKKWKRKGGRGQTQRAKQYKTR